MSLNFHNIISLDGVFYSHFIDIVTEAEYQGFETADDAANYFEEQVKKEYPEFYNSLESPWEHIDADLIELTEIKDDDIDDINHYIVYVHVDEYFIKKFKEYKPHLFI